MRDVLILLLIAAFFALCVAYVSWCDRIIGPDPAEAGVDIRADAHAGDLRELAANDGPGDVPGNVSVS